MGSCRSSFCCVWWLKKLRETEFTVTGKEESLGLVGAAQHRSGDEHGLCTHLGVFSPRKPKPSPLGIVGRALTPASLHLRAKVPSKKPSRPPPPPRALSPCCYLQPWVESPQIQRLCSCPNPGRLDWGAELSEELPWIQWGSRLHPRKADLQLNLPPSLRLRNCDNNPA